MTEKKKRSSEKSIWSLFALIPSLFGIIKSVIHHIKAEAYLTIKSIVTIIILGTMLGCLLTATWIGLLIMLFYELVQLQWVWYSAAAVVVFINLIVMLTLGILISKMKNRLDF